MSDLVERLREMLADYEDLPDTACTSGLLSELTFGDLRALLAIATLNRSHGDDNG